MRKLFPTLLALLLLSPGAIAQQANLPPAPLPATGTWTPVDASGAGLSLTVSGASYVKIGPLIIASARITYPVTVDASNATIGGLPFVASPTPARTPMPYESNSNFTGVTKVVLSAQTFNFYSSATGTVQTNANFSGITSDIAIMYQTAQ